jgi:hypothetical protein
MAVWPERQPSIIRTRPNRWAPGSPRGPLAGRRRGGGGQAACSSAHLHLRPRRSRSAGINHEGHRRLDVSQDAGTVFAHPQSGEAGRGQQAPAPEASVGDFLRFTLVGPLGVHPNSPQSVIFALQRRNELALTLPLECVPLNRPGFGEY